MLEGAGGVQAEHSWFVADLPEWVLGVRFDAGFPSKSKSGKVTFGGFVKPRGTRLERSWIPGP